MRHNSATLNQNNIDIVFKCEGSVPDHPAHELEQIKVKLTDLLSSGNPICTEEDCDQFDQELSFIGWASQDE